jgi:hypothetical protein
VGQRAVAFGEPLGAELSEAAIRLDLVAVKPFGERQRIVRLQGTIHGPCQVDGGGPGAAKKCRRGLEVLSCPRGQRHPVCRRKADRWRAAHRHRADAIGHPLGGSAAHPRLLGRQAALVEHEQLPVLPAQRRGLV